MVIVVGVLQADGRFAKTKADVEKLTHLDDLFRASRKWKCNVGDKSRLAATFATDVKCSGTFKDVGSGTQIGMVDEKV